jgi:hypothetical protein
LGVLGEAVGVVLSWGCRRGHSFDLALVLKLLAKFVLVLVLVLVPASGIGAINR